MYSISKTANAALQSITLEVYSLEDKVSCHPLHVSTDEIADWP